MTFLKKNAADVFSLTLLAVFLIVGLSVYDDYGIAWDEDTQYRENGLSTIEFIIHGDIEKYLNNPEKYHGPAFEILLIAAQWIFDVDELDEIFKFRHLISFIFFWISAIFLGLLLRKKYPGSIVMPLGIAWYFLMPRIFADAFYNSKDIPMLAMTIICLWSMVNFVTKPSTLAGLLHGLCCGFVVAIRITGIIIPALTIAWLIFEIVFNKKKIKDFISHSIIFIISFVAFTILFWPVLWVDPVFHFTAAWNEMSKFAWHNKMRYLDAYIMSDNVPWHYNFVWIGITTPILYLLFFVSGLIFLVKQLLKSFRDTISQNSFEIICVILITATLGGVILLDSVVYDAWRHIFFLYAPIMLSSIYGLYRILNAVKNKILNSLIMLVVIAGTFSIAVEMYKLHPYQNVYFNYLSGVNSNEDRFRFELDYWGLSYREALEKLVVIEKDTILLCVDNGPAYSNTLILREHLRNRVRIVPFDQAEYFMSNYRWAAGEFKYFTKIDSVVADNITINSTFKIK